MPKALYSLEDCERMLDEMFNVPDASLFHEPVKWKEWGLLTYPQVIKRPMDFGTIRKKLKNSSYLSSKEFIRDMDLVFSNGKTFNAPGSPVHLATERVEQEYKNKVSKLTIIGTEKSKSRKSSLGSSLPPKTFTDEEKKELGKGIANLSSKQLEKVIKLIQKHKPTLVKDSTTEIELDINILSPQFLTDLQAHVAGCKKKRSREKDAKHPSKKRKISLNDQPSN